MKRYLAFGIIAFVAIATIASGALLYRAKKAQITSAAIDMPSDGGKPGARPPHMRGEAKARVILEEFGDFECPPCESLSFVLAKLEKEYGSKLRVIFREFPLQMHAHAAEAARVAEAAGMQGRFWEMHEALYRNRNAWSKAPDVTLLFESYAETLRLDLERFRRDLASEQVKARVAADQERGTSLGVTGTPAVFVNRFFLPPTSLSEQGLRAAIDAALRGEKPALSSPLPSPVPQLAPASTP